MRAIPFEQISFVVQGPVDGRIHQLTGKPITQSCLESIRQWCPGSEIVLSTWKGADVGNLDYDVLVTSDDPGALKAIVADVVVYNNGNRQIVSTKNGLKQASRKFAVKLRGDLLLQGNHWLDMWNRFPERVPEWRIFRERVITSNLYTRHPLREVRKPFHPSDWFMFGLRDDLLLLWDVEMEAEPESTYWFRTRPHPPGTRDILDTRRYFPEQYLWKTLLLKFGKIQFDHLVDATPENIRLTRLTFANNLIVLDTEQFPFLMLKYGTLKRSWRYSCISHREWLRLHREYCCGDRAGAAINRMLDVHHLYEACYMAVPSSVRGAALKTINTGRQILNTVRAQ